MNHAITIGGLLLTLGIGGGLLAVATGALVAFGEMMSDGDGDGGKRGCAIFLLGIAITAACMFGLIA